MASADSPITQVPEQPMASSSSPITQVSQSAPVAPLSAQYYTPGQASYPSKLILDLRGTRFEIDRDTLVSLPESILIVMFPNGLILRPQASAGAKGRTGAGTGAGAGAGAGTGTGTGTGSGLRGSGGHHPSDSTYTSDYSDYSDYSYDDYDEDDDDYPYGREDSGDHEEELEDEEHSEEEEEMVIQVDFDPACLQYILDFYRQAQGVRDAQRRLHLQEQQRQMQQRQQQHQQQQQQQQQQGNNKDEGLSGMAVEGRPPSTESSTSSVSQPVPLSAMTPQNPLLNKQAIIVLREELDYFAIPPPSKNANNTLAAQKSSTTVSQATASTTTVPGADDTFSKRDSAEGPPALLGATPSSMPPPVPASGSVPRESSSSVATATAAPSAAQPQAQPQTQTQAPAPAKAPATGLLGESGPSGGTAKSPLMIKTQCGRILLEDRKIFAALQRNINKEKNQAEQHLMDMLCVSGFQKEGEWGYRKLENKRTTIVSVAMVMLRTTAAAAPSSNNGQQDTPSSSASTGSTASADGSLPGGVPVPTVSGSEEKDVNGAEGEHKQATSDQSQEQGSTTSSQRILEQNQNQMAIAQKLLLFWRKPARKCWWDGIQVEIEPCVTNTSSTTTTTTTTTDTTSSHNENSSNTSNNTSSAKVPVRLWARRTWTLELVLI
ncbi:hypothetical protein EC968_005164 [Mortierella alpina]|nr:hypothetical protein EC968_005164 [Mortierella alpina]